MKNLWDIFIRGLALALFTGMGYKYRVGNLLIKEWIDSGSKPPDAALIFKRLPSLTVPIESVEILQAIRVFDLAGMAGKIGISRIGYYNYLSSEEWALDASDRFKILVRKTGRIFLIISIILLLIGGFSYSGGRELHRSIIIYLSTGAAFQLLSILSFVRLSIRLKTRDHFLFNRYPWEFAALFITIPLPVMLSFGISDFEGSLWPYVLLVIGMMFILFIGLSTIALGYENFVTELRRNA